MNELIHIRNKIQTRIKSMDNDKAGNYAKKMMRRCIKDIDAVIDAKKITNDITSSKLNKHKTEAKEDTVSEVFNMLKNKSVTKVTADYLNDSGSITSFTVEAK